MIDPRFLASSAQASSSGRCPVQSRTTSPAAARSQEARTAAGERSASARFGSSAKRRVISARAQRDSEHADLGQERPDLPGQAHAYRLPDLELDVVGDVAVEHEVGAPPLASCVKVLADRQPELCRHRPLLSSRTLDEWLVVIDVDEGGDNSLLGTHA